MCTRCKVLKNVTICGRQCTETVLMESIAWPSHTSSDIFTMHSGKPEKSGLSHSWLVGVLRLLKWVWCGPLYRSSTHFCRRKTGEACALVSLLNKRIAVSRLISAIPSFALRVPVDVSYCSTIVPKTSWCVVHAASKSFLRKLVQPPLLV